MAPLPLLIVKHTDLLTSGLPPTGPSLQHGELCLHLPLPRGMAPSQSLLFQLHMLFLFSHPLTFLSISFSVPLTALSLPPAAFLLWLWRPLKRPWVLKVGIPGKGPQRLPRRKATLRKCTNLSWNKASLTRSQKYFPEPVRHVLYC